MDEETLRKMAIAQYLQGKEPISIYREFGKTPKWFFKWLKRYRLETTIGIEIFLRPLFLIPNKLPQMPVN